MPAAAKSKVLNPKSLKGGGVKAAMALLDANNIMNQVESHFRLQGSTVNKEVRFDTCVSTGVLTVDLLYNGGLYPGGWYINFGDEGSCKSTLTLHELVSLLVSGVPLVAFMEPEGTSTDEYIQNIAHNMLHHLSQDNPLDMGDVFGKKDESTGKYIVEPRVWYYPENSLQTIWKSMAAMLRRLPDKVYEDGEWWLLFMNTKANQARYKEVSDSAMSKRTGKVAVKSIDGGTAQAVILLDSLAMMVADEDDDDDGSEAFGMEARGHSKQGKKVKGLLKRKHAILVATNQMRSAIPKGGRGPTEREPGGNALRMYSDVRLRMAHGKHGNADGYEEHEDSIDGKGKDTYRFIRIRTVKNKYGTPRIENWLRLWENDREGDCQGIDPVWDVWNYLKLTGQVISTAGNSKREVAGWKGRHEVVMYPSDPEVAEGEMYALPKMAWVDFKQLVLLRGDALKAHCKKLGITKNPRLRQRCQRQISSGQGLELFHRNRKAA